MIYFRIYQMWDESNPYQVSNKSSILNELISSNHLIYFLLNIIRTATPRCNFFVIIAFEEGFQNFLYELFPSSDSMSAAWSLNNRLYLAQWLIPIHFVSLRAFLQSGGVPLQQALHLMFWLFLTLPTAHTRRVEGHLPLETETINY